MSARPANLLTAALLGALCLAFSVVPAGAGPVPTAEQSAPEDEPKKKREDPKPSVDAASVYYGRARSFKSPAEISMDSVYAEIEEYKEIVEKKLEPKDPEYAILVSKAARRFRKAVRKAAKAGGYDLVAESGSVKDAGDVADITSDVIDEL